MNGVKIMVKINKIIGIDLGIINLVVLVMEGNEVKVILNVEGGCIILSIVVFKGDEILVGEVVKC